MYVLLTRLLFYLTAYSELVVNQRFNGDRLLALGPDLAASSFLLSRNCRVKFKEKSGTEEVAEKSEGKWTRYGHNFAYVQFEIKPRIAYKGQ